MLLTISFLFAWPQQTGDWKKFLSTNIIDPDKHIFGIPFGTSKKEFTNKVGYSMGYIKIEKNQSVLIYGKMYYFFFNNEKLSGIMIGRLVIDPRLSNKIANHELFNHGLPWILDNGLARDSSLTDAKNKLGLYLKGDHNWEKHYTTRTKKVVFTFSHNSKMGDGNDSYQIMGLRIVEKKFQ